MKQVRWTTIVVLTLASALVSAPAAAEPNRVLSFELHNTSSTPPGVKLVIKTETGDAIPKDKIEFKIRGKVVRVTFKGYPLTEELGMKVMFDESKIKRIEKGYAIADTRTASFVRLRFDDDADKALEGHTITPGEGGTVLIFPFGAEPGEVEAPGGDDFVMADAEDPEANNDAEDGGEADGATNNSDAATDEAGSTNNAVGDADAAGSNNDAEAVGAPSNTNNAAATDPPTEKDEKDDAAVDDAKAAPIAPAVDEPKASDPASTASFDWDDPFGSFAVIILGFLLVLALLAVWAFMRSRRDPPAPLAGAVAPIESGSLSPTDVQLLARYSLGENSELLVVKVLGEIFVIGNGPLTLLRRMSAEPMGDVWGAVDDVQTKLRALLLQMQQTYQPDVMPSEEVGAIVEKLKEDDDSTIDFQEALKKRREAQKDDARGDDDEGATSA